MLELRDKASKATIIAKLQEQGENTLETNGKIETLWKEIKDTKNI